jgi:MFS family permease
MADRLAQAPFRRTTLVWTLYLLLGLFSFTISLLGPAIPYLRLEFHLDYTMAAMHMSMFAVGMVAGGLGSPRLLERLGPVAGLWGGMAGALAGMVLLVLAPTAWLTLAAILFMSLFATVALASIQASLGALFPFHRGKAFMEANVVASLGSAAAPFLIVLGAMTVLGWRIIAPAFAVALGGVALFGWPATRHHGRSAAANAPDAPGPLPPAYWVCWVLTLFCVAVEWCLGFWTAEYLKGLPGRSLSLAAAGAGVFQVAAVAARLISSRLAGRISETRVMAGAMALVAAGFPLFWLRAGIPSAFLGVALCGMGAAAFYPLALSQGVAASGQRVRQASSYAPIASGLALALAPLGLGRLADHIGLRGALLAIPLGLGVMGLLLGIRIRLARRRQRAPGAAPGPGRR